jgi:hypothetical protein
LKSIQREKQEIEARYGIRIGQTDIKCFKCGRPWGYGRHTCQDMRFQRLKEVKKGLKMDVTLSRCEFTA